MTFFKVETSIRNYYYLWLPALTLHFGIVNGDTIINDLNCGFTFPRIGPLREFRNALIVHFGK